MLKRPIFNHDCEDCIFLGRFLKHDLYVHPNDSLVARFGDNKFDVLKGNYEEATLYGSFESNAEEDRILFEALKRSVAIGILPPKKYVEKAQTATIQTQLVNSINSLHALRHEQLSPTTKGLVTAAIKILSLIED